MGRQLRPVPAGPGSRWPLRAEPVSPSTPSEPTLGEPVGWTAQGPPASSRECALLLPSPPPAPRFCFYTFITHGPLRRKNIKWKIPELNGSSVLNARLSAGVQAPAPPLSILTRLWRVPLSRVSRPEVLPAPSSLSSRVGDQGPGRLLPRGGLRPVTWTTAWS